MLDALLAVDFVGAEGLRRQAAEAEVVGKCVCGCPSVDFLPGRGRRATIRVNAGFDEAFDGLFLYTVHDSARGDLLGGIQWAGAGDENPDEFPPPHRLRIQPG